MPESIIRFFIYLHAGLGGIALLSGTLAMIFQKGKNAHKKSGKVFFICLLISAVIAIIISLLPNHYNPFLLSIGIFSLYLLLSGYRALRYKRKDFKLGIDKLIASIMLITGLAMILLPLISSGKLNIVLSIFGGIGLFSAIRDLLIFNKKEAMRKSWLRLHLGNMMGAYIASFTAFLVVNNVLPNLISWLGPTVIGTFFIIYWNRKLRKGIKLNSK